MFDKFFHSDWRSEIRWKKVRCPNWIAANFNNIRKMHSTVERMDACKYSKKWLQYLLLKELFKQWMTASSPVKINIVPFKEWILSSEKVALQKNRKCWIFLFWKISFFEVALLKKLMLCRSTCFDKGALP